MSKYKRPSFNVSSSDGYDDADWMIAVDNLTLEIASDKLQLKSAGVQSAHLQYYSSGTTGGVSALTIPVVDETSKFTGLTIEAVLLELEARIAALE